ncbi:unnamed protein product [Spirodela intermedia]|uniref:Uncharacterized protein n=1 Tax=Spirodela intermedia TaxID=51605 RepID=A0A7I8K5M5_SPIIN|nr:unnamed protein product [Spirodela intermedia]
MPSSAELLARLSAVISPRAGSASSRNPPQSSFTNSSASSFSAMAPIRSSCSGGRPKPVRGKEN